jgi:hypothetical protein
MPPKSSTRARLQTTIGLIVATSLWWWHRGPVSAVFTGIASILALLAWFSPARFAPIGNGLDRVAQAILVAFTWMALGLVYFGVFMPLRLGWILRGRNPLERDPQHDASTYLIRLAPKPSRFERPF